MASRYFNQFPGSFRFGLKFLEGTVKIGASGAVVANSYTGGGLSASSTVTVQKMATGLYRLQLADPYNRFVGGVITPIAATSAMSSGTTGFITDGNLVIGAAYQIVGGTSAQYTAQFPTSSQPPLQPSTSTNWYTLGLYPGQNPQVGATFVATSGASNVPGSSSTLVGQGQVARIIPTTIAAVEILPGVNTGLSPSSASSGVNGAVLYFQTLNSSLALASPAAGSWLRWNLWLDNSSRALYNESTTAN